MFQCSYVNNHKILAFHVWVILHLLELGLQITIWVYDVCSLITKLLGKGSATSHLMHNV